MNGKTKKDKGPLQIEKSKASFLYDREGRTYIDCISGVSHGMFKKHKNFLLSLDNSNLRSEEIHYFSFYI